MHWYNFSFMILIPLLQFLLSRRKKQNCIHEWFNMAVIDHRIKRNWVTNNSTIHAEIEEFFTGELARLCKKCCKMERHIEVSSKEGA